MDKRKDTRFRTRFDALYSSGAQEGAGVLTDISYSGARVEDASMHPEIGTHVRLYIFLQPVAPFELEGEVVRADEAGFAVIYKVDDPETRRLVDDVAAMVATPS